MNVYVDIYIHICEWIFTYIRKNLGAFLYVCIYTNFTQFSLSQGHNCEAPNKSQTH